MSNFFEPFHELRYCAAKTDQRPTRWSFGMGSREEVILHLEPGLSELHPADKLFGIPTEFDPDLPDMRVVLKAGRNTIGAFTIKDVESSQDE